MKRPNFSWKYAIIICGVVLLAYLVMAFNNRVADLRHQAIQKESVAANLESLEETRTGLGTQIAFATSDAAVVEWAYDDGNMIQDGDHPVVVLPVIEGTQAPPPTPFVAQPTVSRWQMWWWLFVEPSASKGSP